MQTQTRIPRKMRHSGRPSASRSLDGIRQTYYDADLRRAREYADHASTDSDQSEPTRSEDQS